MAAIDVKLSRDHRELMLSIGDVIAAHTAKSPMTVEAIVGVLGFCAGAAIVRGEASDRKRRDLRSIAAGNIDNGMDAMRRATTGSRIILPGMN
ncbi:MAG: hypothetical protein AB7O39_03200 [Flavobacteriaceae bacterium]